VIRELIPVAQQLGPTLTAVNHLAPYLRRLFVQLGPLITASNTGLPATQRLLRGLGPNTLLDQLGPFLEQLNPILVWLEGHQQLTSDFISDGGASFFARTATFGGNGTGHYLRQFGPSGPETLSLSQTRDANNRGNDYPSSLWLGQIFPGTPGKPVNDWGLPAWDCRNTGASGNGQQTSTPSTSASSNGNQACWVQPILPGASQYKVPPINAAAYSRR
jgi:phospholipid/cholesterol/gamma-HCH transport system substrate-binding protein